MSENSIVIKDLEKDYKVYVRKKDRLIETIFPFIKRHGIFKALTNLNLEVKKGEVLGILGKNGAGKSTLLKIITGVVTQTKGDVEIKGKISSLLELGTAFNPELTGYENIYQHGQVMGLTTDQIKAREKEIIEFADIGDHLYQPVKNYSSGMFARLAFSCAINVDPDILIVDEVLSVGDMSFQLKCFKKFEQFKNSGKTILFVTHSINDVLKNCTKTIILDNGRKIYDGDTKNGVETYKKLIVGLSEKQDNINERKLLEIENQDNSVGNDKEWKSLFNINDKLISYGNKDAEIVDYGVFDLNNKPLMSINNNESVNIKLKVKFNKDVDSPIFAMSVKDFNGVELCGTNTLVNRFDVGLCKKDEVKIIEFSQILSLAPGKYTLSFGCTKFKFNGELEVFDRKYDTILIEIVSNNDCLGLFDLKSKINISDANY